MAYACGRQCCKALQFQVAMLLEQQSADKRAKRTYSDEQFHKIIALKDEVKSLEENLRVVHREKREIQTHLTTAKQQLEGRVAELQQKNAKLVADQRIANKEHRMVQEDFKEMHRAAIQRLALKTHSDTADIEAAYDRKLKQTQLVYEKEKEKLVSDHEEEIRQHVAKLQRLEKESREALMELNHSIGEKQAAFNMDMKTIQSMYLKKTEENNEYQRVNKALREKLKPQTGLLNNLSTLKWTLVTKNNLIETKNTELAQSKKENADVRHLLAEEQASYLLLNMKLESELAKNLKDELKETQLKVEQKDEECRVYKQQISDLQGQIVGLKDRLAPLKANALRERRRSTELKAYQLRFKAQLLACMDLISRPSAFVKSVIAMKRHFIDDDDLKVLTRDKRCKEQILNVANNVRRKLVDGECRQVMDERRKYFRKCKDVHKDIRVINEQTVIIRTLQDRIKEMQQDLNKKTKEQRAQRPSGVDPSAVNGTTGGDSAPLAGDITPTAPSCPDERSASEALLVC